MLTYIKKGRVLDYIPVADVAAGTAVKIGAFVGVTNHAIAAGELGGVELEGIYSIPNSGVAFDLGTVVEIDSAGEAVTSGGSFKFGYAVEAALATDAFVKAKLVPDLDSSTGGSANGGASADDSSSS